MKVLVTGITGMIGSHFAEACKNRGWEVFGIARDSTGSRLSTLQDPRILRCDLLDSESLAWVFKKVKPDIVAHFAAQAFNSKSWDCEEMTHETNIRGTRNLLRCCRDIVPDAKVLLACSSAEYGIVDREEQPLKEKRLLRPISPYGITKVATENLGYQYYINYGLKVYLPRLFIHVGTGHPPATSIQNFSRQLALIKKGGCEPIIRVGDLEPSRDFIDVRDGVNAMLLLLDKGELGEPINICTGEEVKIKDVLRMLIEISGIEVRVEKETGLFRLSDEKMLVGDNSKLKELGWERKYTLKETLQAVYKDWLNRTD